MECALTKVILFSKLIAFKFTLNNLEYPAQCPVSNDMKKHLLMSVFLVLFLLIGPRIGLAGDEFTGQFETTLIANTDDLARVVLKGVTMQQLKGKFTVSEDAHLAAARLTDPRTQNVSIIALLVEEHGEDPFIFVDMNGDNSLNDDEKVVLKRSEKDNPYIWQASIDIKLSDGMFKSLPMLVRYLKSVKFDKMGPEDRLLLQSTEVMARAHVSISGKDVLLQYTYNADKKKVDHLNGWLGVDTNGNGEIDIEDLSAESTRANDETVVFRAGDLYVSTKKADIGKNQVVVRQNQAKDYKRAELWTGKEFPQFAFTDFDGKKHNFNDYRGKYVLLDIWGLWCPACRDELPYLREANRRFQSRGLVVLGLNTDEDYTVDSMKSSLAKAGMTWTHAQYTSVADFVRVNLRIHSFPSTFLLSPEGKIISMNRTERQRIKSQRTGSA